MSEKNERELLERASRKVELFVNPLPTVSMGHFKSGSGFSVHLIVDGLKTEAMAIRCLESLQALMCGDEIQLADAAAIGQAREQDGKGE